MSPHTRLLLQFSLLLLLLALAGAELDWRSTDAEIRRVLPDWSCSLPVLRNGSDPRLANRWAMVGADEVDALLQKYSTPGLGNYLIFWPSTFWFAALTGREIIIGDGIMSEWCYFVGCSASGFSSKSDMVAAGRYNASLPLIGVSRFDMIEHLKGNGKLAALPNLRGSNITPASEWWTFFPFAGRCVSKLSRCPPGDVGCSERFAFQRLAPGPFRHFSSRDEGRLQGMPRELLQLIRTVPHAAIGIEQRISAAFHIRREFMHFENGSDVRDPVYLRETHDWSNGTEASMVYDAMAARLVADLPLYAALRPPSAPVLVYVTADNNHIKHALAARLRSVAAASAPSVAVKVMLLDSPLTHNSKKRRVVINGSEQAHSLLDLAFDWYLLSLSNYLYGWRIKGGGGSTFVGSAGRVSGNFNSTNQNLPLGQGAMYTKKYQYCKSRRGGYSWQQEWGYNVHENYENLTLADVD